MTIINNKYHNHISSKQVAIFIDKTPSHLIHEKNVHESYNINKEHVFQISLEHIEPHIPSILHSIIPTILLQPCIQLIENQLDNFSFIISFRKIIEPPFFIKMVS